MVRRRGHNAVFAATHEFAWPRRLCFRGRKCNIAKVADFDALNHLRSQTLRQIREMVSEEAALWAKYFHGQSASEILADIDRNRSHFRALWNQHEKVRQD